MYDRRFASLRGHARQFLDDYDDEELRDQQVDLDAVFGEPSHDGWSEIRPVYEAMRRAHEAARAYG